MDPMGSSKQANNTVAFAHQDQHQHRHQDVIGTAAPMEEARKASRQQQTVGGGGERNPRPQLEEALKCPRCESNNTKFCYYNNYSVLQPRFFCKACRRYWTQGGSLRNIPVGGGSRKYKHSSSSSTSMPPSSSSINELISSQNQHLVPASSTGFPNVLPTFMSTGSFELPHFSLPLAPPLSLSSLTPAPALAPAAATQTRSSFLDLLRGGLVNSQGSGLYEPTITNGANEVDVLMPPSFDFGGMQQHERVGNHHEGAPISGATEGGQWPTTQHGPNIADGDAAGSEGGQ
ncbi:hypothetical protein EJB05_03085 [Eragrostis curvula]|uniref:Dof zinc finger protein n=1 Tax=Eragrostis curvula TaxID=38414 RepID=A0A5J9WV44_9POAL|nr:hypothetical protein EJB05_03085 [Eragrostis curvula]